LRWAAGAFLAVIGALMLVSPYHFASSAFSVFRPNLFWWGVSCALGGVALLGVAVLDVRRLITVAAHILAGGVLLLFAADLVNRPGLGALNYAALGVGLLVSPWNLSGRFRLARLSAWLDADLFVIVTAVAALGNGLTLLLRPDPVAPGLGQMGTPVQILLAGWFLAAGMALLIAELAPSVPHRAYVAAAWLAAGAFWALPIVSGPAVLARWTSLLYYVGTGALLVVLPWVGPRLRQIDPASLRVRLCLALALGAAVPVLVVASFDADREIQAVTEQALAQQQALAVGLAQDVADYVGLHQAAVQLLAAQPGLLALSPAEQHAVLANAAATYGDVNGFGTIDAAGDPIARADDRRGTSFIGDSMFETARRTLRPSLAILVSPVLHRPIFSLGAPIVSPSGSFLGVAATSVDSTRVAALLAQATGVPDTRAYLVDDRGVVIAHPDADLVAQRADLTSAQPVHLLLTDSDHTGSLRYTASDETDWLAGFAKVPQLGWGVVVEQPESSALASMRLGRDAAVGVLLAVITLAASIGAVTASRFVAPLHALARAANRLAAGDASAPLPASSVAEVAELARQFHHMRQELADRDVALQQTLSELRQQREELERSNRELQDFASIASHDLQEPLRKVRAFGDRLERKLGAEITPDARDCLVRMQDAAARMSVLISDLLRYSRVTTHALPLEPVDLGRIAREVIGDLEVAIERSNAEIDIGPLPTVEADALQMRQLFQNLLSNALKFQQPETPPRIAVQSRCLEANGSGAASTLDSETQWYELRFADNGIGFDEKYLDRIFTIFQRLHGRTSYEGSGVGLAVCRKIVDRHGGHITAQSTPGKGATFLVTLPTKHEGTHPT
jgi:signal transduction histidine kinase